MTHVSTAKVTLHNGVQMPTLGLGAFEIEGNVADVVYTAIQQGYRLIDTAAMYGNEAGVGEAVRRAVERGIVSREEIFVTTKVWKSELGYEKTLAVVTDRLRGERRVAAARRALPRAPSRS